MHSGNWSSLQRQHLRVADHTRQEVEQELASLKQPAVIRWVATLLFIVLNHLLKKRIP